MPEGTTLVVDYGAGNLRSAAKALEAAGAARVVVSGEAADIAAADRIVLPGVGAFGACAAALRAVPGMVEALEARVRREAVPFLGICVGMQLMATRGEEMGEHEGLGWIHGTVRALTPADAAAKVPHMGWNHVTPTSPHPLIVPGEAYFLHSFAFVGGAVLATTDHGGTVTAAIGRDNLIGVQFHPEKSQRYGLAFLSRFLRWKP
ncbi:MAG: imidazole glycerol phosphate synthase subunit HisH [Pseudomonadota bacterium]|nr:imidazole glycerol phosphate synthase subunit HisH [Pseudomonadota bacterium]